MGASAAAQGVPIVLAGFCRKFATTLSCFAVFMQHNTMVCGMGWCSTCSQRQTLQREPNRQETLYAGSIPETRLSCDVPTLDFWLLQLLRPLPVPPPQPVQLLLLLLFLLLLRRQVLVCTSTTTTTTTTTIISTTTSTAAAPATTITTTTTPSAAITAFATRTQLLFFISTTVAVTSSAGSLKVLLCTSSRASRSSQEWHV